MTGSLLKEFIFFSVLFRHVPRAKLRDGLFCLWHRPDPDEQYFPEMMTILGHTPTGYLFGKRGKMFQTDTWIDIDTGAAGGGSPMLLRLDDLKAFYADIE